MEEFEKPKLYSVPVTYKEEVDMQVQEFIELNLIEVSSAEISHPIDWVAKKDATVRLCIDYRVLNSVYAGSNVSYERFTRNHVYCGGS